MIQIRLLLDEDACSTGLAQALRSRGLDVVTVGEVDRFSFSDESHLVWAAEQGRSIYSHNMGDFCRLHGSFMAAILILKNRCSNAGKVGIVMIFE